VMDRTNVEQHLLNYNRESFRAASASPCGAGKFLDDMTFSGLSPAGTDLLNGSVSNDWCDQQELLREFLKSFSTPQSVRESHPISTSIEAADVKRGFGRWREQTSTSPSGRHLGHYRAAIQDDTLLRCLTKFLDRSPTGRLHFSLAICHQRDAGKRCWVSTHQQIANYPPFRS
jgi:hypothetical protein